MPAAARADVQVIALGSVDLCGHFSAFSHNLPVASQQAQLLAAAKREAPLPIASSRNSMISF